GQQRSLRRRWRGRLALLLAAGRRRRVQSGGNLALIDLDHAVQAAFDRLDAVDLSLGRDVRQHFAVIDHPRYRGVLAILAVASPDIASLLGRLDLGPARVYGHAGEQFEADIAAECGG